MKAASLWSSGLRPALARVPALRRARRAGLVLLGRDSPAPAPPAASSYWEMPPEQVVRLAYNVLLRREPDPGGLATYVPEVASGRLSPDDLADRLRTSDEHRVWNPPGPNAMLTSLHLSRCEFIIGLPRAERILDLGGSHHASPWGSLVQMGYPYRFTELVIVDLPPEQRHDEFSSAPHPDNESPRGPVRYAFHSMTDLSAYADGSFDLVYSGQSIEHITAEDADVVLGEVHRVLRPGGHLALDTPNRRATAAQGEGLIHDDHDVEYTHQELSDKLTKAGFAVEEAKGLNLVADSLAQGRIDEAEAAAHHGVYRAAEDCYLLAYVCRRD